MGFARDQNLYITKLPADSALALRYASVGKQMEFQSRLRALVMEEAKNITDTIRRTFFEQGLKVRSGNLLRSIKYYPVGNDEMVIEVGVPYASYLEHGTYSGRNRLYTGQENRMKIPRVSGEPLGITARKFIKKALDERYPQIIKRVQNLSELIAEG